MCSKNAFPWKRSKKWELKVPQLKGNGSRRSWRIISQFTRETTIVERIRRI